MKIGKSILSKMNVTVNFSLKIENFLLTSMLKKTVENAPPMKPSHVFLGDNLMSRVRPKKKPGNKKLTKRKDK